MGDAGLRALRLLIIRHGKAEPAAPTGREWDRRLVARGEAEAGYVGNALRDAALRPTRLLHSPLVRATQTAMIISRACGCSCERAEELALDAPLAPVLARIAAARGEGVSAGGVLALVGHNPRLEELAALVCEDVRGRGLELRTGEALVIDFAGGADLGEGRLSGAVHLTAA